MAQTEAYKKWRKLNPNYQNEWLAKNKLNGGWEEKMKERNKDRIEAMNEQRDELLEHTRVVMGLGEFGDEGMIF